MKRVILIFSHLVSIFLVGCASTPAQTSKSALKFSTILNFKIGATSQDNIVSVLGEPTSIVQKDDYFTMNYNDPETDFQRFSANINRSDKILLSFFWLPNEKEAESSLDYAKNKIYSANFQVEPEKSNSSHMISTGIVFYIDKKVGITLRYDKRRNHVEAIALYERENRISSLVK